MDAMPLEAPSPALGDLDDEQREAVLAARGPVCVLAGAGTGKTRTITRRIAHLVAAGHVAPSQVLAVTFTARAAGEMRGRLRALGQQSGVNTAAVQAVTFHAAARRQLQYFWPRLVGDTGWELLDSKFAVVAQAANRAGMQTSTDDVRDLAGEIEWAKASLITPEGYGTAVAKVGRDIPFDAAKVAAVYSNYEKLKARRDGSALLDFDDLLLHTAAAIENDAAVAQEFRDRYRCFVVDEYQDVTPLQQRVLDAWLGERDDLTVVGDANQTIYSFTGATPRFLLDFSRRFPDAAVVRLERDYRSTPQVVSLANRVIAAARGRMAGSKLHLVGQRDPGPEPRFSEYPDEVAEANAVARDIKKLIENGTEPAEIAVLYRINAQSEVYEEALTEAGVAFQVRGGEGFFSRQEIRQALVAMQRFAERDIPEDDLPALVRELLEPLGLTAEPPAGTKARERWEALTALAELVDEEVALRPELDLRALVAELRQRADSRHPPVVQGVTLASLHAAKGLEWDAVFLVGLADNTLPISHALAHGPDSEPVEEERRLLYVGVTRARVHLGLSWALARTPGGRQSRRPSRFLNGIAPQLQNSTGSGPDRTRRQRGPAPRCRVCNAALTTPPAIMLRRCETCPSDLDEELLAELKEWRLRVAKEMKVPAYVVFTDNTLIAIAESLPADEAALVALPGIGARKLEQYGPDVLELVKGRQNS
ncbi:ATP-dependent DNA helicase [Mycolicibacterium conceptionense]|jgi:DNA helicase-2/ATP-dependent DNA helicase PcrA|uniref:ATP-dependent DNA helicase UvrD2 n=4 Tax=Mycolicibacterium TaxID=1866885 RepID=A0A0J8TXU3_9MYCO|nr:MULTISPECIES: ATP-dependent DNA helicase UvrD2 [Mycolicibacterium]KLI04449.1 ATP-dependent DNA helicase [Mycolicibacterium senegalense]KLO51404.1 ATP-dependent DNA helicase [Mycolicibacterium senegalense]KMV14226.1 ATP-dependent DNA helicase [Mycolicibacterium conceptionense]OBK00952.1 ATP-dependent DNA helicase [Mycolicibacterium conceptionense]OMB82006.1 ATP-dependent DNA helicase [Mycolicibacterium conceptionense]